MQLSRKKKTSKSLSLKSRYSKDFHRNWQLYAMVSVPVIYVLIFSYFPMYGLQIAFKNYRPQRGIIGSEFVGLEHFIRSITYPDFWRLIKNTLTISLYSLCTFPCAIIFALLLNEVSQLKVKKTVQMVTYAPHFMSEVVVCALVFMLLDRSSGPINNIVAMLGGERVAFMSNPDYFASVYVWSGVWQGLGWNSILYISALSAISPELVEAAKIDGATRMQIIRHVNLPGILPTISITFIMRVGGLLSVGYTKIFLLQNDLNIANSQVIST